jgi:hypothetical protein
MTTYVTSTGNRFTSVAARAPDQNTTVLTRGEMSVIQSLARGGSMDPDVQRQRALDAPDAVAARSVRADAAAERKARMIAIDEARRANGNVSTLEDLEREATRQRHIAAAREKIHEEVDEVKRMNQIVQGAKCVTIRDAQVLDKQSSKAERAEEQRRLDMMMELERLKALRMYEERELKRVEDRRKGAAVIRAQMDEREQERLLKQELRQQEQEAMLRHIQHMRAEDQREQVHKKEAARALMEDVALANAEQIRLKNRQRLMEVEEDRQIAAYVREKERREQELADEQARIKREKEHEIARLRATQERAQDKRAEVDALRARRAQEASDRELRQKEKDATARQAAINKDLAQARELQMREKAALLADQARAEMEEFDRIIATQKGAEAADRAKRFELSAAERGNAEALRKQIAEVEENRRKDRRDFLDEGLRQRTERREREALVDAIRLQKVEELEALNVPKPYRQELLKKRPAADLRASK